MPFSALSGFCVPRSTTPSLPFAPLAGLVCGAVLMVAPAVFAQAEVAALPVVAEGLLPSARDALDADIRAAVESFGVTLQPAAETRAHLDEGSVTGLDCRLTEDACALRVGLIADVDAVLVTTVELIGDRMLLRGAWLVVDGERRRHIAGEIKMPALDGGHMLRAALGRLVTGKGEPTPLPVDVTLEPATARLTVDEQDMSGPRLWLVPGAHEVRVFAEGHEPIKRTVVIAEDGSQGPLAFALAPAARVEEAPTLLYVGASIASVGAILAMGGVAVVGVVEADLQGGKVANDRRADAQAGGVVALACVVIGTTLAAGGAAAALLGTP